MSFIGQRSSFTPGCCLFCHHHLSFLFVLLSYQTKQKQAEVINKETWLGNFDKEDVKLPASLKEKILTKNVPYDCFIADDEYKAYRSARVEELNTIKPPENVSKIKKLTRRLTDHS